MPRLEMPRCQTCGETNARECPVCERWTCWECVVIIDNDTCQHSKPTSRKDLSPWPLKLPFDLK